MARRLVALLAVALLSATACGDTGESDDPQGSSGDGDAPSAQAVTVRATDFAFDVTTIETDPGATVDLEFVNAGNVDHSVTIEELDFDEDAESGETLVAAFTVPDEDTTLTYKCRFHPSQMTGEIVVGDGGSGDGGSGGSGDEGEDSGGYDY